MDIYREVYSGLYYFDTFTFTTLGTSGHRGPDSTKTYANAPWREGDFSIENGQQQWTVPASGTYHIEAAGAYGATPGRVVSGDVDLNEGQVVSLLVGQQPNPLTANVADNVTVGGGGGTFVTVGGKPLIVASGGDGGAYSDNPWSQPVIVPFSGGAYVGFTLFADETGTYFTRWEVDFSFTTIGSHLYEYDGTNWNVTFLFPDDLCMYVDKTLGVAYSFTWLDAYTVRASDWSYTNGIWTKTTYVDLSLPFQSNVGNPFGIQVSGNGETLRIVDYYYSTWAMYKRIDNQWVFVTTLPGVQNGMSYDGNRIITPNDIYIDIYDYPWTSPPTQILISEPDLGNNNCTISPDGTLLVTFSNLYSLSDGSVVTSLPGYVYGPQADLNISKDNKTIVKGFIGSELQVLDYPFTQVNAVLSPVTAYSFYGPPLINEDGSVIIGSDILSGTSVYYKNFKSQSGLFLPSGTGGGDSGAGFFGDGSQTNPYFQFLKPQAYIDGGFGNMYWYGHKGDGGFGGGQGPLNKYNKLTQFTISESPSTFSLGGNPQVVSVNSDATVMYYGTTRYLYSGGSWNYDQDFGMSGTNGFLSVSDDGMTAVTYTTGDIFGSINNIIIGIVTGTQSYSVTGYKARVNKQGTRVAFSQSPGPNIFIRDAPFTGGDYQLTLPASFPLDSNVSSFDFSSDGSVLAMGFNVGNGVYAADGALRILITRYPWTTYETINNVGNIVALSPDGQTLFAAVNSSDASFIYKYEYTSQSEWQRVSRTSSGYKNTIYLATGSDGSLFVKPSDISLYFSGYPSLVFNFTSRNAFSQVGSVSNSYVSNMSSDGQHIVNYDGTSLKFYNKQTITVDTLVDHGFPQSYQVKYELTANYNGIHDITVTTANTFTFQGFCFANESGNIGAVSGVETGVSGGGGYTGSPGDGVSGATCYADPSVRNFTDLGATSNSAGYVTVSLIDPVPITLDIKALNPVIVKNYSNRNLRSIIWSPEFGKYFAVSANQGVSAVVYSTDLDIWTATDAPSGAQFICWSPKLKLFTIGKAVSSDGLSWTSGDSTKNFYQIVWCDFMNSFFAWIPNMIDNFFDYTYPFKSADGLNWTAMTDGPLVTPFFYGGYSSSASVGPQSLVFITNGIVYSFDGTTWLAHQSNGVRSVYYNNQFVLFLSDSTCYTSLDGTSWSYKSSFSFDPESIEACTIFENTLYLCSSNADYMTIPYNRFYSSQDLLTWTQIDPIGTSITNLQTTISSVVNVNSILLASTSSFGKTLVSVDFRVWSPLTTSSFRGSEIFWATLCFSPETGYLVATGNTDPEQKTVIYYSNDAVTWNSVTLDTEIHDVNEASWMPAIGKFIFNGYYLVDPLNNWEVSTIPDRPNGGFGIYSQWYPIGKVLICTNGDQTNDAYNWRNDTGVTVSGASGTPGISGGWLYPSTMMAIGYGYIRTSTDAGKTWITTNYQASGATFGTSGTLCIVHSPPPYVPYSIMTSTDGITWTPGTTPGGSFFCYGIFWISSIKMFAAVFQSEVSVTSDGINWSPIYSFSGESGLRAATWCENINTLVVIPYSGDYTLNITF
jgi:hypothetical protein